MFIGRKAELQFLKQKYEADGGQLYSEAEFLLHQELRETAVYNSLIEAIALGSTRLNAISQKALVENTSKTSVYLRNLIELGIVRREFSIDASLKETANSSRGIYRLTDHFFRFWYAFPFTSYSELEAGDVDGVYQYAVAPFLHEFAAFPFEEICRQYVQELQKADALPFRYARAGRWFGRTTVRDTDSPDGLRIGETEIDLVAFSRQKKEYLIGECKFKSSPFRYSDYLNTLAKLTPQKEHAEFYYALFSESGFDDSLREEAEKNDRLLLFPLDAIVNCRLEKPSMSMSRKPLEYMK